MGMSIADIKAAAAEAMANPITPREIVALLDRNIAEAVASGQAMVQAVSSDGTSTTMVTLESAKNMRAYYASLGDGSSCVSTAGSFA